MVKIVFLLLGVFYGFSNLGKLHYKQTVGNIQILLMSVGIVGFIYLQFLA